MKRSPWIDQLGAVLAASLVVGACASPQAVGQSTSPARIAATPEDAASPALTSTSPAWIEHATGATDVLLRFDNLPDHALSELGGETFYPGPEFSLYGDGTVIYRDEFGERPPTAGPIIRGRPFTIGHLDEGQVQSVLRFALGEGGLADAPERYELHTDTDDAGHSVFTINTAGVHKMVDVVGSTSPLDTLADYLRHLDQQIDFAAHMWEPDRFWGLLVQASHWINLEILPDPDEAGSAPWPWPELAVSAFLPPPDSDSIRYGRRAMSTDEATVLGLSDKGGVVQRVYFTGPDGLVFAFSLWPMLPDEVATPTEGSGPIPTPAPSFPVVPAALRIDGLARVVTDRLRVRSAPEVSAASERLQPLLETGAMLFVIDGPVAGSGYDWYMIVPASFGNGGDQAEFRFTRPTGPMGWVASAARDGTPWIAGVRIDCPDPAAPSEGLSAIERLGPLAALSCYGDRTIQFRAFESSASFVDGFGEGVGPGPMYPDIYWDTPGSPLDTATFGSVLDPARFPNGETNIDQVVNVIGHFDDPMASQCDAGQESVPGWEAASSLLTCRTTFVVTDLDRVSGDPR